MLTSLLILPCLDRGEVVAAVHDTAVYGVWVSTDSEDDADSADVDEDGYVVGDEYVSDDDENEAVERDAADHFGPDEDEKVSDGSDIED